MGTFRARASCKWPARSQCKHQPEQQNLMQRERSCLRSLDTMMRDIGHIHGDRACQLEKRHWNEPLCIIKRQSSSCRKDLRRRALSATKPQITNRVIFPCKGQIARKFRRKGLIFVRSSPKGGFQKGVGLEDVSWDQKPERE